MYRRVMLIHTGIDFPKKAFVLFSHIPPQWKTKINGVIEFNMCINGKFPQRTGSVNFLVRICNWFQEIILMMNNSPGIIYHDLGPYSVIYKYKYSRTHWHWTTKTNALLDNWWVYDGYCPSKTWALFLLRQHPSLSIVGCCQFWWRPKCW